MIFNSITYFLFLVCVVTAYWNLKNTSRYMLVFLTSLIFYGFWRVEFIPVLLFSITADWFISQKIERAQEAEKKKWVSLSIFLNLSLLLYFKYLLFFAENIYGLIEIFGGQPDPLMIQIILPLGISFYTFQTISYIVDVYRGVAKPEKNYFLYAAYVIFFPQLIAGPILRVTEVIPQLKHRASFSPRFISSGITRILYGIFLKVVLADNIAPLVEAGFSTSVSSLSALDVWTLAFLFGFQIYFDFSGYSHIAIGSALLMGIRFPENFNFPYLSSSPKEFWKRWHISLSSWIRDYLYLPLLGKNPEKRSQRGLNSVTSDRGLFPLFATWSIMGLWHGASWTFVVWGVYHATVIAVYRFLVRHRSQAVETWTWFGTAVTLPVMMLGWIPFRSETLHDTFAMWFKVIQPQDYLWLGLKENTYLVSAGLLVGLLGAKLIRHIYDNSLYKKIWIPAHSALIVFLAMINFIFLRPVSQYIYFQF